jgi:glycosyltransferase involved in cell wall biosynthesis
LGLCGARNLGLEDASGDLVCYLDDDNAIASSFIQDTISFFDTHPQITYSMARQRRQRNVLEKGQLVKSGKVFVSPSADSEIGDLLLMQQLFDSNGFVHHQVKAPSWNPELKVFADYEYLLKCASIWGEDKFQLNPSVLVNYIQTSEGIIGQSNYGQWSQELQSIWMGRESYSVFETFSPEFLLELIDKYQKKNLARLTAFM